MCKQMKEAKKLQFEPRKTSHRKLTGSVNADIEGVDEDVRRYGSAMFVTQGKSNDFTKSYDTSEIKAIPIKKKQIQMNQSKTSTDMHVLEKAKEMNDVVLAKNKDGQFLMNRLKERLSHGEQRRNEYLERSIEKIKEHNSAIYSKMEQREEKQATEEIRKRDEFLETLIKIQDKNKEKDEMIKLYASELREKQTNAMQNAKERKSTLDK